MTYQVLARKWRPRNFKEIVGQNHVVRTLVNAIRNERLHHAYLFTGTRGVGKTTIARILAKALNCEQLNDGFNPCGQCENCQSIDQGRFLDLIEVDAASRTKVEDTRELMENVQYAPNSGRYKIYIIDEVHMLSGHSFNALLKTLEEPPPHVKFLLATTDPQKIPVTVLSRCLQFNLKRMLPEQLFSQMEYILQQEKIIYDPQALRLLARAADGSMRDGLSLLDQAIVYSQDEVNLPDVENMLGTVAVQAVHDLLMGLALKDAQSILQKIDSLVNISTNFVDLLHQIIHFLHKIALFQIVPSSIKFDFDSEMIKQIAQKFDPEDIQLFYQIALKGQKDLDLAPDLRSGFEMIMLRMLVFRPSSEDSLQSKVDSPDHVDSYSDNKSQKIEDNSRKESFRPTETAILDSDINSEEFGAGSEWNDMILAMKIGGMTRELANNCVLENIDDKVCTLRLDPNHNQLGSTKTIEKLQTALQNLQGKPLRLVINTEKIEQDTPAMMRQKLLDAKQKEAEQTIEDDQTILMLKERFDARVLPGTIEPDK